MFGLLHIFTIISYYFYSTAYISLKRNEIKKGKEQNTWCNRNQSFLQCSCVQNGERRNYPQCNMISPTMHTRWHSVYVWVLCVCGTVSRGGVFCNWKITKCQDLPKFEFPKGGGGVFCNWKITKYQDLPKYEFSRGGGVFCNWKITKYQDLPKYEFSRWGGILQLKS